MTKVKAPSSLAKVRMQADAAGEVRSTKATGNLAF